MHMTNCFEYVDVGLTFAINRKSVRFRRICRSSAMRQRPSGATSSLLAYCGGGNG